MRRIRFREAMTAASFPRGGKPSRSGWKVASRARAEPIGVTRKYDARVALKGCDETAVAAGDSITIETPGGGGFGLIHGIKGQTDGLS